jgi:hypothetical protein
MFKVRQKLQSGECTNEDIKALEDLIDHHSDRLKRIGREMIDAQRDNTAAVKLMMDVLEVVTNKSQIK